MKIYYLQDPNTGEIRYVGITSKKLNERLSGHIYTAKNTKGRHVCHWIKQVLDKGFKPEIYLIEECTDENWEEREIFWIEEYRRLGHNLTNTDKGGKGVFTKEKRELSSIERSARAKYKAIYQLNLEGEIIQEFESLKAAQELFNIKSGNLNNALLKGILAVGYFWCYKDKYNEFKVNPVSVRRQKIKLERLNKI